MKKIYKVIIEDTCEVCPFCSDEGCGEYFCKYPNRMITFITMDGYNIDGKFPPIPKTCPLENYEEECEKEN